MIIKAKDLGILTLYETERKNGSQSSNLYSFNRFPQSEPPKAEKLDHPKETNNLLKTNNKRIINVTKRRLNSITLLLVIKYLKRLFKE